MKYRIAKKIVKNSCHPKNRKMIKEYIIQGNNGKFMKLHKIINTRYLPYNNEQIFKARRIAKDITKNYYFWFVNHGDIMYGPPIMDVTVSIGKTYAPVKYIKSRYNLMYSHD